MGGYPADYYVMPDHMIRLSDDRKQLWIMQPLPGVNKKDLNVEIHDKGFCLDFKPEKKQAVHKCWHLAYEVDPDTAKAEYKNGLLTIMADLKSEHMGKSIEIM